MACFVNKYIETPETHKELRWRTINLAAMCWFSVSFLVLISILLVVGICSVVDNNTFAAVYCFVFIAILVVSCLQIPIAIIKNIRPPKKYGKVHTEFFDNRVEIHAKENTKSISYSSFQKIVETPNFFVIVVEQNNGLGYLPVKKDGLNSGPAVFESFINEKIVANKKKE